MSPDIRLLALVALCVAAPIALAQFAKYRVPAPGYVPCFVPPNNTQRSYCPPGTECVESQYASNLWPPGLAPEDLAFSQISAPGCCPPDAPVPCFSSGLSTSVPGCCPNGTVCCMDPDEPSRLVGCARSITQCCGGIMCPTGYSCCDTTLAGGAYCCPGENFCTGFGYLLPNATVNNTDLPPDSQIEGFVPNPYDPALSNALSTVRLYGECQLLNARNRTIRPWTPDEAFPCGRNGSWCRNGTLTESGEPDVCVDQLGTPLDPNNQTLIEEAGRFCCPANTTACASFPSRSFEPVFGCADEGAGETCCGSTVCGAGSRCCDIPSPPWWQTSVEARFITGNTTVAPVRSQCCPNGTFCCATLVPAPGAPQGTFDVFTYCGRNANCTSLSTVSEAAQPVPSLHGFYPDFIEDRWVNRSAVALATVPPGAVGECGTCRAACLCWRGGMPDDDDADFETNRPRCADQCELNPVGSAADETEPEFFCGYDGAGNPGTFAELETLISCGCQGFVGCPPDDTGTNLLPPC